MPSELKTIAIMAFRDDSGRPACSIGIEPSKTCHFLGFARMGMQGVCMLNNQPVDTPHDYIRPHAGCLLWDDDNAKP
jgi:hypothetical protein